MRPVERGWWVFDPRGGFWCWSTNPALLWLEYARPLLVNAHPELVGVVFEQVAAQADRMDEPMEVADARLRRLRSQ